MITLTIGRMRPYEYSVHSSFRLFLLNLLDSELHPGRAAPPASLRGSSRSTGPKDARGSSRAGRPEAATDGRAVGARRAARARVQHRLVDLAPESPKPLTGIVHHPRHVWRVLGNLGRSLRRPARRACERDEAGHRRVKNAALSTAKKPCQQRRHTRPCRDHPQSQRVE